MKKFLGKMKHRLATRLMGPVIDEALRKSFRDIPEWRQQNALVETGQFVEEYLPLVKSFPDANALIAHAVARVESFDDGLVCEFGVATGKSINYIAGLLPNSTVYGFDSFEGLPEDWQSYYPKGSFKMDVLPQVRSNVQLIKGWFCDTLPPFLKEHEGTASFLHIDCDLYSSTKDIFDLLEPRLRPGTVIVFDEYFNYPGWKHGEHKAFMEFTERTGNKFQYIGYVKANEQVAVKLIGSNGHG